MCTVTWVHEENGYHLLCNRDERHTRQAALSPQQRLADGVRYLAPADGDSGGSWIAVNEYGLTLALLNETSGQESGRRSRGHLVTELARARTITEARGLVTPELVAAMADLQLVMLEPGQPAFLLEWDGERLTTTEAVEHRMPLTSSSFDAGGVEKQRMAEFVSRRDAAGTLDKEMLLAFHCSHGLGMDRPSAYTTCMHREYAQTVSFSRIAVTESEVQFFYVPGAPCQDGLMELTSLSRRSNGMAACG